jgi:hypothetical protein
MDLSAFGSDDHRHNVGSGAAVGAGSAAGAGRNNVTVAPTTVGSGGRGLRVQGMPWRRWLTTTPGRLRGASALLVVGLLAFAAVTTVATEARSRAAGAVATSSAPELVNAESLYGNLADADATASTIFLRAGQEPRALRRRYLADVAAAGRELADISRSASSSPTARRAVRTISERLPAYTGLVESARANNAQGFPVGSAYLREASATMHDEVLPAATDLYRDAARQLRDNYQAGTSTTTLVVVLVAGIGMLALLVVVQVFVRRRSNRLLNLGLVAAAVLVVGLLGWTLLRFSSAHDALNRAQQRGSDSVEVLSSARILTLRAQNNDNLALIERGTGDVYVAEFERVMGQLGGTDGTSGLLGYAAEIADRTGDGARVRSLAPQFTALRDLHTQVRGKDDEGDYSQAVALSVGTSDPVRAASFGPAGPGQELAAVDQLQRALQRDIDRSQVRLATAAQDAHSGFGVLEIAIPVFAVIAALLVLLGLERRIGEYR